MKHETTLPLADRIVKKIEAYYLTIWKDKLHPGVHVDWLNNFVNSSDEIQERERLNALYLLSKFMYFGNAELRELLKCMFRDLFKYRVIKKIRESNNDTKDSSFIEAEYIKELQKTRFLGVGNPSESGVHLLYYFRQENKLSKECFINPLDIFQSTVIKSTESDGSERERYEISIADENIKRYIFVDDFCGSGTQAKDYSQKIVKFIKSIDSTVEVSYLMLFGTEKGIDIVRNETEFDYVEAIFSLDESFRCFSDESRYYLSVPSSDIEKQYARAFCNNYGNRLFSSHPLGYKDSQLLLGLFHNTPDNTLPIFWSDRDWNPIFKRYHKIY